MPEHARVVVVEDSAEAYGYIEAALIRSGHAIINHLTTRNAGIQYASGLVKEKVDVVILDGNLGTGDSDGQEVLKAIKQQAPNVKTVGFSGRRFPGVDYDLGKMGISELGEVVTNL